MLFPAAAFDLICVRACTRTDTRPRHSQHSTCKYATATASLWGCVTPTGALQFVRLYLEVPRETCNQIEVQCIRQRGWPEKRHWHYHHHHKQQQTTESVPVRLTELPLQKRKFSGRYLRVQQATIVPNRHVTCDGNANHAVRGSSSERNTQKYMQWQQKHTPSWGRELYHHYMSPRPVQTTPTDAAASMYSF